MKKVSFELLRQLTGCSLVAIMVIWGGMEPKAQPMPGTAAAGGRQVALDSLSSGQYVGQYVLRSDLLVNIFHRQDGLYGDYNGDGDKAKLVPVAQEKFFIEAIELYLKFDKDSTTHQVKGLYLNQRGVEKYARKLSFPAPTTEGKVIFKLKGYSEAHTVAVAGSFNDWHVWKNTMAREEGGWVCTLELKPGKYPYKLVVDGNWINDPGNPRKEKDKAGYVNSIMLIK